MASYTARVCAWHSNASPEAMGAWERLDRASRTPEGRTHKFCREYTIEAGDQKRAMTEAYDRFVSDAVDAGLYDPDQPLQVWLGQT